MRLLPNSIHPISVFAKFEKPELLMTPSLLTPSINTPAEQALPRRKPLPPMKEMRLRWSKSNQRFLPACDQADIPRYENTNGIRIGLESEDDTPY